MAGVDGTTDREFQLEAMNAVLGVVARHVNLLKRDAFEDLAATLATYVPFGRMVVMVPEETEQVMYAASFGDAASPVPPFGARFPLPDPDNQSIVMQGKARVVDDARTGDLVDRLVAQSGYLSYVALAIQRPRSGTEEGPRRPVAKLIICWRDVGTAGRAPLDLLQQVADLFGQNFDLARRLAREHRLSMILETSRDAMLAWDKQGRITDANAAASVLTGLTHAELLGMSVHRLVDPLPSSAAPAAGATAVRAELDVRRGDEIVLLPVSVVMTTVDDDPLVAAHALLRDESHVVAAEREAASHLARVRTLEKELRTLLDNAPLIIFRMDAETGQLQYLSRQAERVLGVPTDEALHTPGFLRGVHEGVEAASAFDDACERARRGTVPPPYEARLQGRDREMISVRGTIYPLMSEKGRVVAIEGVLIDVSTEQAARTKLVETDRLSTLGVLAAGVAHEINNPAAFLLLELDHLERAVYSSMQERGVNEGKEASGRPVAARIAELRRTVVHIVDIARDLRLFASSSNRSDRSTVIDVNRAVESALTLTRGRVVQNARIVLELGSVSPVLMDEGRLGQVIVNLLVNAAQAIPATRDEDPTEHVVQVTTRSDGRTVRIEVSDTGVGIPHEMLEHIWMPFFTTKSDVGTGLGLSISREIVERAGGTIVAVSPIFETPTGARGSRFVVTLPSADHTSMRDPSTPVSRSALAQRKRVLVVEDEAPLARALAEEIEAVHDVVVTHRGEEALALINERRFDVVLCDLVMPGMSGEALYRQVRALDEAQAQAFIFMTALGFGAEVELFVVESGRPLLEKPFEIERLLSLIGESADSTPEEERAPHRREGIER